jgi:TRAP-type C4-dicarboxylate transport system permease small subunit
MSTAGAAAPLPDSAFGLLLDRISATVAMLGGAIVVVIVLISSLSVLGRSLPQLLGVRGTGVPGDVEMVQLGCAVAVYCFLPLCQLRRANVLVGIFTRHLAPRWRATFDLAANLLFLVLATGLALALGWGVAEKFRDNDTSMMLRIPEGWPYAAALLPSWLLVLTIVYSVLRNLAEIRLNRPIGPPAAGEH